MASRREKLVKRLLASLNVDKNPSGTPGPMIRTPRGFISKKDRRASGWSTPSLMKPTMKYSEVHAEALEPEKVYDEWSSERDGWRMHTASDQLYHKWKGRGPSKEDIYKQNNKIRKQIRVRKAKLLRKNIVTTE